MPELSHDTKVVLSELRERLSQNVTAYEWEIDRLDSYQSMVELGRLPEFRLQEEIAVTARRLRQTAVQTARMPIIRKRAVG